MIFRDKKTGDLLNIRRDEYPNDRLYFKEMIGIIGDNSNSRTVRQRRYSQPFDDIHTTAGCERT